MPAIVCAASTALESTATPTRPSPVKARGGGESGNGEGKDGGPPQPRRSNMDRAAVDGERGFLDRLFKVGWAWQVRAMSSAEAPNSIADDDFGNQRRRPPGR